MLPALRQSMSMQLKMLIRNPRKFLDGLAACKTCTRHVHLLLLSTQRTCLILKRWCKSGIQKWRQPSSRYRSRVQKLICMFLTTQSLSVPCVMFRCTSLQRIIRWLSPFTSSSRSLVNSVPISISNNKCKRIRAEWMTDKRTSPSSEDWYRRHNTCEFDSFKYKWAVYLVRYELETNNSDILFRAFDLLTSVCTSKSIACLQ